MQFVTSLFLLATIASAQASVNIQVSGTNLCWTVAYDFVTGANPTDAETLLSTSPCVKGLYTQKFNVATMPNGAVQLTNTGYCTRVYGGLTVSGTPLVSHSCGAQPNGLAFDQFNLDAVSGATFQYVNDKDLCVAVVGSRLETLPCSRAATSSAFKFTIVDADVDVHTTASIDAVSTAESVAPTPPPAAIPTTATAAPGIVATFAITDYTYDCATGDIAFNVAVNPGPNAYCNSIFNFPTTTGEPTLTPASADNSFNTFAFTANLKGLTQAKTFTYEFGGESCHYGSPQVCSTQHGIKLSITVKACAATTTIPTTVAIIASVAPTAPYAQLPTSVMTTAAAVPTTSTAAPGIVATFAITDYTYDCTTGDIAFNVAVNPGPNAYCNSISSFPTTSGEPTLTPAPAENSFNTFAFTANVKGLTQAKTFTYEFGAESCHYGSPQVCSTQHGIKLSFTVKACEIPFAPILSTFDVTKLEFNCKTGAVSFTVASNPAANSYVNTFTEISADTPGAPTLIPGNPWPSTFRFTAHVENLTKPTTFTYTFTAQNCHFGSLNQCYNQKDVKISFEVAPCGATKTIPSITATMSSIDSPTITAASVQPTNGIGAPIVSSSTILVRCCTQEL
ncbi:hypothetical protein HDU98_006659 [Podochytrium sp. JEL0797]|nr:hypothetical protein HDU98_006659 [Podochytrium sp. JEL0797]